MKITFEGSTEEIAELVEKLDNNELYNQIQAGARMIPEEFLKLGNKKEALNEQTASKSTSKNINNQIITQAEKKVNEV